MNTPKLVALSVSELTAAAGIDPWRLQDQLLAGKPYQISALAEAFHRSGSHAGEADSVFDKARQHFQDAYISGDHSDVINDSRVVEDTSNGLPLAADDLRRVGTNLEEIAGALSDAQHNTHDPIDALNRSLQQLDAEIIALPKLGHTAHSKTRPALEQAAVKVVGTVGKQLNGIVEGYETVLNARMKDIESTGYIPTVELDDGAPTTQIPPSNTDPVKVNKWWDSLTPAAQQAILAAHPDVLGNLNGIPVTRRDAANRQVMNNDIHKVQDATNTNGMCVPITAIEKDPKKYGLTADDMTRYHNAINVRAGLNTDSGPDQAEHSGHRPPTYLYAYQPLAFGGKGRAAIAIGNPDTAPNTAVLVPGASQSVRASDASDKGWFATQSSQAQNLYVESNRADPGHPTAVVAWMGYDDPANGLTAVASADPSAERAGGKLLAHDVDGLWATHQGPSHVTVVGYSAGAIVTSDAAAASHLHANDMVLLGPVSTDQAHHAADFHLDHGHVYVGESSNDANAHFGHAYVNAVSHLTGHGGDADPTAPGYGATRIKAETPASYDSPIYYTPEGHLHYFDAGSESLYATTDITSGNADRLAADHMLATPDKTVPAPGRAGWEGLQTVQEGETTDGVKDDHYH